MAERAQRLMPIAAALLAGLLVWWMHFPVDGTALESGEGQWAIAMAILVGVIAYIAQPAAASSTLTTTETKRAGGRLRSDAWLDFLPLCLAGWVALAGWLSSSIDGVFGSGAMPGWGNARHAASEAAWWVAAAFLWIAARRVLAYRGAADMMFVLIVGGGCSLALQAAFDHFVALPALQAQFEADPETFMRQLGVAGPPGSAVWMVAENRIRDGGATATFALANSLAAPLLVAWMISLGLALFRWTSVWLAVGIASVAAAGVFITGSRTAMIAGVLGTFVIAAMAGGRRFEVAANSNASGIDDAEPGPSSRQSLSSRQSSSMSRGKSSRLSWLPAAALCMGLIGSAAVSFGKREWIDAAPASVSTRFQYWQTTLRLLADHPLVGSGPGNFQLLYEHYRDPLASEQIADPHHFLFETAGAGGLPALLLLVGWMVCVLRPGQRDDAATTFDALLETDASRETDARRETAVRESETPESDLFVSRMALGVGVGLLVSWMFWFANHGTGQWHVYVADLVGLLAAWSLFSMRKRGVMRMGASSASSRVALVAWGILTLHLSFSGGMTVPGISMLWWTLPAFWRAVPMASTSRRERASSPLAEKATSLRRAAPVAVGLAAMIAIYLTGIRAVEASARFSEQAMAAQAKGNAARTRGFLKDAMLADPWSRQAAGWWADAIHWEWVQRNRRGEDDEFQIKSDDSMPPIAQCERWTWAQAARHTSRVAGQSAVTHRELARQAIHLYQVHGRRSDLRSAARLLESAVDYGPSNEKTHAQLALVLDALGQPKRAHEHARRARELSSATQNPERDLNRIRLEKVEVMGGAGEIPESPGSGPLNSGSLNSGMLGSGRLTRELAIGPVTDVAAELLRPLERDSKSASH
ncbi:MAG: O-antigen ligase family protein [Planctomycetota bacterium]